MDSLVSTLSRAFRDVWVLLKALMLCGVVLLVSLLVGLALINLAIPNLVQVSLQGCVQRY